MKIVKHLVVLILAFSIETQSCESPYALKVGAFFNSASNAVFWSDFAHNVSLTSKCQTKIIPSPSFEEFILDSMKQDGDMFLVPAYYAAAFKQFGLRPILRTVIPTKSYLVTRKELDPLNMETLIGKRVSIISPYSDAYLAFVERLKAKTIKIEDIKFSFERSLESNAMSIVKGETDAAVIFSVIFDPLPDALKRKVNYTTLVNHETAGYLLIKENTPIGLIEAIKASYESINLLKWEVFEGTAPKTIHTDAFSSQILLLKGTP